MTTRRRTLTVTVTHPGTNTILVFGRKRQANINFTVKSLYDYKKTIKNIKIIKTMNEIGE
jgi:hypothetical protein